MIRHTRLVAAAFAAAVFVLASTATRAAIIGNVLSWSQDGPDVTIITTGNVPLRLSVLADDVVRFRFDPTGAFPQNISHAVVGDEWPEPPFTVTENAQSLTILTGEVEIIINKMPCHFTIRDLDGNLVLQNDPTRRIQYGSGYTKVYNSTQNNEAYLGLGWRPVGGLKRNGTKYVMKNVPTYGSDEVFYSGIPFWYGVNSGRAYGIFFDDTSWGDINVGKESPDFMSFSNLGGQADWYFFYGPDIQDILDSYTRLTGRPFLPPKWATGFQQCRWSYYPQQEVLDIAAEFRNRSIPCDVIYHDIDYMNKGQQLSWDPVAFPNPAGMNSQLHSMGFHTIANIGPWLLEGTPWFNEAASLGYLLRQSNGQPMKFWHNYIYFVMEAPTGWMADVDFTNPAARDWYAQKHYPFLSTGIDGIWNDLNEPDEFGDWPVDVKYNLGGLNANHNKTSVQYSLYQSEFSYNVLKTQYPDKRPYVLSRGGYAGIQRAAVVWSGDNTSNWTNHFKVNIPMGLSMSLSGQPHNGHDIGGFMGYPNHQDPIDPQLYARWMQAGVFSSFARAHHNGDGVRDWPHAEPWMFGTGIEHIAREFINLRYQLMPYMYSLFWEAHQTGAPIQRPTVYEFQSDANTLTQDYDFMFGPYMLIAPVYTPNVSTREVYLPEGTGWTDWWSGFRFPGGQKSNFPAPLNRLPIFIRDGAIIPMGPIMQHVGEKPLEELTLKLYPADGVQSTFEMFEDDEISFGYQQGEYALTNFGMSLDGDSFALDIAPREGSFVPHPRHYLAQIHNWTQSDARFMLNGQVLPVRANLAELKASDTGVWYDALKKTMWARFPDTGAGMSLTSGNDTVPPLIHSLGIADINGGGVILGAVVEDADSGVQSVEFFVNDQSIGVVSQAEPGGQYLVEWGGALPGAWSVEARALDNQQNQTSRTITLRVTGSPREAAGTAVGDQVLLRTALPIMAVFPNGGPEMPQRYLYAEDNNRASGIRVRTDDPSATAGMGITAWGVVREVSAGGKDQGERYLDASGDEGGVRVASIFTVPDPLGIRNSALGWLNSGLYMTTWGIVTGSGATAGYPFLHINDGSSVQWTHDLFAEPGENQVWQGTRVYVPSTGLAATGDWVIVEGISSVESPVNFSEANRVLRVDSPADITVLQPGPK